MSIKFENVPDFNIPTVSELSNETEAELERLAQLLDRLDKEIAQKQESLAQSSAAWNYATEKRNALMGMRKNEAESIPDNYRYGGTTVK